MSSKFDKDGLQLRLVIPAHDDSFIWALTYLPDGRRVVTGAKDRTLRVWNLENGEQQGPSMEHGSEIRNLAVTRDGTRVISGDDEGKIRLWNVDSHELVKEWTHSPPEFFPYLALSPDDRRVAVGKKTVVIYTMQGDRVGHSIEVDHKVWSLSFSPDGSKLACGSRVDVFVYNVKDGTLVLGPLKGHTDWVCSTLWSHDGGRLFTASGDKTICCWDTRTGEPIGSSWAGHTDRVRSISLSLDGSILASASDDRTVRFWDANTGRPIGQDLLHGRGVSVVCFSPSGESVVSAGSDGTVCLWSAPSLCSIDHQTCQTVPDLTFDRNQLALQPRPTQLQCDTDTFTLDTEFPEPPDLTSHIIKINNQYSAGGSFGDVHRCRYIGGLIPSEVAVKAFRFNLSITEDPESKSMKMFRRELGIWKRLKHENIVPFLGVAYGFGIGGAVSLVSSWMPNESLHKFLVEHDEELDVVYRLQFLLDIANGLQYLHSFPIVHGDLNCNNVVLDADYTARLVDFGYASLVGKIPEALVYLQRSTARPGALRWMAPEQIDVDETFSLTPECDIYSFGCVSLQVLSGKQPWSEVREDLCVIFRLAKGERPGRPESRAIEDPHWDLIQHCWSLIQARPTSGAIVSVVRQFLGRHPQPRLLCDLLRSCPSWVDHGAEL